MFNLECKKKHSSKRSQTFDANVRPGGGVVPVPGELVGHLTAVPVPTVHQSN